MGPSCLSVLWPCATICDVCRKSFYDGMARAEKKLVDDAERVLRSRGYSVAPPVVALDGSGERG